MIGIYNGGNTIEKGLGKKFDVHVFEQDDELPDLQGLFIDWVSKDSSLYTRQAFLIENYVRKMPIVIFDRYMCLSGREFSWLRKFNVNFLEPAVNNRREFSYLPQWMDIPKKFLWTKASEAFCDICYIGPIIDRIKLFEKYYRTYAQMFPKKKVVYTHTGVLPKYKMKEWKDNNLIYKEMFHYGRTTVVIDSPRNMEIGYMWDNLEDYMKCGALPLLPREHRYFCGMFRHLTVENERELDYYVECYGKDIRTTIIEDLYGAIEKYYPEFTLEYAVDKIGGLFE